ncbi:hypothetical protein [Hymenobacter fastidiosus]|uniref:hypothetical protein n=1 Tax=Hymenobacter fastidiosus TaxID=486264 RepID=UPI0031EBB1F0
MLCSTLLLLTLALSDTSTRTPAPLRWRLHLAPLLGGALPQLRLQGAIEDANRAPFEPNYLQHHNVDGGVRPVVGFAATLFPRRGPLSLHAGMSLRPVRYHHTFATGHEAFPTKTYHLRTTAAQAVVSLRYHRRVGPVRVLAGFGTSLLDWWNIQAYARYDGVNQREAYGISLPVADGFLAEPFQQSAFRQVGYERPTLGFCEEVGATWQRYTLTLSYRHQLYSLYYEGTSVSSFSSSQRGGPVTHIGSTPQYGLRATAFYATLSYDLFRLGERPRTAKGGLNRAD